MCSTLFHVKYINKYLSLSNYNKNIKYYRYIVLIKNC